MEFGGISTWRLVDLDGIFVRNFRRNDPWCWLRKKSKDVFLVILATDFVLKPWLFKMQRPYQGYEIADLLISSYFFWLGIGCGFLLDFPQKKRSRTYIPFTKTSLAPTACHSSPDYVQQPTLLCLAGVWDLRLGHFGGWSWGWFRGIFLFKGPKTCANTCGERDISYIYIFINIYICHTCNDFDTDECRMEIKKQYTSILCMRETQKQGWRCQPPVMHGPSWRVGLHVIYLGKL